MGLVVRFLLWFLVDLVLLVLLVVHFLLSALQVQVYLVLLVVPEVLVHRDHLVVRLVQVVLFVQKVLEVLAHLRKKQEKIM